jgi:hypothetical protein
MTAPGTDHLTAQVASYAEQVRTQLADLPAGQKAELLEDLEEHLAEVAAESDEALEVRLGPAARYAEELREAALLPQQSAARVRSSWLSTTWGDVRRDADRLWQLDAFREARAFLPELRPAWWVLRAWLGLLALDFLFGSQSFGLPFPTLFGLGPLLGLPLLIAAVALSVRLGRRAAQRPQTKPNWLALAGNTGLALLALVFVVGVQQRETQVVYADQGGGYGPAGYYGSGQPLAHGDGTPITNIYPYSADGEPLSDVLLYDQDGRAVDNLATRTFDGEAVERVVPAGVAPPPSNSYPQTQRVAAHDEYGNHVPQDTAPAFPFPSPSISPSPSPSATPSPSPSASPSAAAVPPEPAPSDPSSAEPSPSGPPPAPAS